MKQPKLTVVPADPAPKPSYDYEWQHRQRVASKNWAKIHTRSDKSPAVRLPFLDLFKRRKRRGSGTFAGAGGVRVERRGDEE